MNLSQQTIDRIKTALDSVQKASRMTPQELGVLMADASRALIEIDLDIKFPGTVQ